MHNSHMIALCLSPANMDAQPSVSEEHIHVKVGINNKNHEINYYIKKSYDSALEKHRFTNHPKQWDRFRAIRKI